MSNQNEETTTVNIKGVSVRAWEETRKAADKRDETLGPWVSRALSAQANLEAGSQVIAPAPVGLTPDQLTARQLSTAALMQGVAAMKAATGRATGRTTLNLALISLEQRQIEAEGFPAARLNGKSLVKNQAIGWQSATNREVENGQQNPQRRAPDDGANRAISEDVPAMSGSGGGD